MRIKRFLVNGLIVIILSSILLGCYYYTKSVQTSLWMQNAEQTLEITSQGGHAFETYITIEQERVKSLVNKMSEIESYEESKIQNNLNLLGGETSNYTVVDLGNGILYSNRLEERRFLSAEELEFYRTFSGKGIRENYLNIYDGHNTMGVYECFMFADGVQGLMQKSEKVSNLSKEFSISFYNESGFSYITNQNGDVLIRPYHKNSNRTFLNIFDMIAEENDEEDIQTFRESLSKGHSGVIQFSFNGSENIITFSPIKAVKGWYIISVIPSSVVMENTDHILQSSQIFIFAVFIVLIIGLIFLLFERQSRKRIESKEQDIQYREQLFSILSENIDDVFLMLNSKSYAVEYVTPNVNRVLGISKEEVTADLKTLGKAAYIGGKIISYPELDLMQPGQSITLESERTHRKTAEKRWFYESVYRVGDGQSDKFIVVLSDRTKDRQNKIMLETALNAANAANRAKSTFLNNISHDIRTPMNAIVGLTVLLNHDSGDQERVKEYTRKITASSQYLLGLINDVLDMSKIESGKTTLNITEINLAELIDELGTMIRPQAKAKQQEFELFLKNVTTEHLIGDRMRINQVLTNILSNAVKYTPAGGRIQMTVIQLPQKTKDFVRLRFEVQDNGIGMSEEFLAVIFEPFAREINSVTNQIQGTGLGMPIVKNLVELMGGTIDVKSRQGEGSLFTVDLELRIQEQNIDEEFWENHRITRVLVVDDDESICTNVIRAMEGTGVSVQYALGGGNAIRQIGQAHQEGVLFDLVLLDWKMPGMDGMQTAREIRAMLPEHIPIILLTAYEWDEIEEEALAAGIDGFLAKPFFLTSFKQAIVTVQAKDQKVPDTKAPDDILTGITILAAEDNELNAEILRELLNMNNVACDFVSNGQELLEAFEKSEPDQYDLILTDIQMPVMNGYDATRAIRSCGHPCGKIIPIVAMTANAFAEDVKEALDAGMNAHVPKPIDMRNLESVIAELTKKKQ
ncbi:hypothetical protein GVanDAA620_26370 [Enterococcus faecium]|uniref:Circadian input-output histidine kinase CikA n=1 Tax=Enterococcus faecium TaxID=1352 RepID=A0A679C7Z9_ENTFC|nr:response regulator [Enterococcus faecium]BBI93348.1 hypothetical protein [Enterococcus faecium]BCZ34747.1 hypothetical protein GVanDAA620_26370 [Enterococcus faecium]BCZ37997.1 hypothetical protein GVanDAA622_26880 [Enterococcus faecium]